VIWFSIEYFHHLSPGSSLRLSVGRSVREVYCGKTADGSGCRLGGEWGQSRNGCIRWGWLSSKGKGQFLGVNVGHPIVINGDFVAELCESDALFPNYFGETCWQYVALVVVLWCLALSASSACVIALR